MAVEKHLHSAIGLYLGQYAHNRRLHIPTRQRICFLTTWPVLLVYLTGIRQIAQADDHHHSQVTHNQTGPNLLTMPLKLPYD